MSKFKTVSNVDQAFQATWDGDPMPLADEEEDAKMGSSQQYPDILMSFLIHTGKSGNILELEKYGMV